MTNELLEILPDHERASGNKIFYEKHLENLKLVDQFKPELRRKGDDGSEEVTATDSSADEVKVVEKNPRAYDRSEREAYEKLCRNDLHRTPAELAPLRCRYVTNKSAFLKIGPLKLEEAHLKPYIVIYHDIIFDSEIEVIKNMAKPRVSRIGVNVEYYFNQIFFNTV